MRKWRFRFHFGHVVSMTSSSWFNVGLINFQQLAWKKKTKHFIALESWVEYNYILDLSIVQSKIIIIINLLLTKFKLKLVLPCWNHFHQTNLVYVLSFKNGLFNRDVISWACEHECQQESTNKGAQLYFF